VPFNGSGTFSRLYSWVTDAANSINISASRTDAEMNGFAAGLSNCVTRDGQSPPSADLPMGGKKLTNLGAATVGTDALSQAAGDARYLQGSVGLSNLLTFNNAGAGAASGATFGGAAAITISYNSIGAAPLASPVFTGAPLSTTPVTADNTTKIATTAYVQANLASYALLASPPLTGTPTAPTAAANTATTQLATTAFVDRLRDVPRVTGGLTRASVFATAAGVTINTANAGEDYGVYNDSAAAITLTQGAGVTLRLAGTTSTGNRTLAARGYATIWFNASGEAIAIGAGVS
jgi:hypothetical protein